TNSNMGAFMGPFFFGGTMSLLIATLMFFSILTACFVYLQYYSFCPHLNILEYKKTSPKSHWFKVKYNYLWTREIWGDYLTTENYHGTWYFLDRPIDHVPLSVQDKLEKYVMFERRRAENG